MDGIAALLMRHLGTVLENGPLPPNTQIVVHPIVTWPEGKAGVWIMVNWPN